MSRDGHLKDIEKIECDISQNAIHSEKSHGWDIYYQDCTSLGSSVSFLLKHIQIIRIIISRKQKEKIQCFKVTCRSRSLETRTNSTNNDSLVIICFVATYFTAVSWILPRGIWQTHSSLASQWKGVAKKGVGGKSWSRYIKKFLNVLLDV